MKEYLQGRRLGFAPRAMLGAAALGVGVAATLVDLMAWFAWGTRTTNPLVVAAYWLVIATAVVCLKATIAAYAETRDLTRDDRNLGNLDLAAIGLATILYTASAGLRSTDLAGAGATPAAFLLAIGGLVVLLVDAVVAANLYAARQWAELEEEIEPIRHRRRRAASR